MGNKPVGKGFCASGKSRRMCFALIEKCLFIYLLFFFILSAPENIQRVLVGGCLQNSLELSGDAIHPLRQRSPEMYYQAS